MNALANTIPARGQPSTARILRASGIIWFVTAALGQLAFVYFLAVFYGGRTMTGNFAGWNDKPLIDGHIPGDAAGNVMFAAHVLLAIVVTLGGLVQLVPIIRSKLPALHRWNGRVFLVVSIILSVGGLWLTWVRGTQLSTISAVAISLNAVLILAFAGLAWRLAAARRIEEHRHWAMRTFMVVNGVWFLRVGLMGWILLNQGPVGMNRTLSGPADIALVFGCYLIPLAVLEVYLRARRSHNGLVHLGAAGLVLAMTGLMGIGIIGTVAFLWGPYV